ncbi:MAG: M67 family peptidase [Dehalococcoidia bacterium]|nr:M67 family peptidase [Dehalococcoidia bacterium]
MLEIEKQYLDQMVAHSLEDNPNECCGILAGPGGKVVHLYRMTNTEHSPYRYNMDAKELYLTYRQIEDKKWDLVAIYHSHTHSPAYPSTTDIRLATWPEAYYILVSLMEEGNPLVKAYRITEGQVKEEELRAV